MTELGALVVRWRVQCVALHLLERALKLDWVFCVNQH